MVTVSGSPADWRSGWTSSDVLLSLTATGPASTTVGYKRWSGHELEPPLFTAGSTDETSVVVSEEGTTTIIAAALLDGIPTTYTTNAVRIDRTPPRVLYTSARLASGWTSVSPFPVAVSVEDTHSGLLGPLSVRVLRGTRPVAEAGLAPGSTMLLPGEGRYSIEASAADAAGNRSKPYVARIGVDLASPVTTWEPKGEYFGVARITLEATDALSGVSVTYYRLDGEETRTGSSLIVKSTGVHHITFWSQDVAGNVETTAAASTDVTFTVTPDTEPPSTTAKALNGDLSRWFGTDALLSLDTSDGVRGSGPEWTRYSIDGGPQTDYTGAFRVSREGTTVVSYWSSDACGNVEAPRSITVRIDRTAPISNRAVSSEYRGAAVVSILASDADSGVGSIRWWIDNDVPLTVESSDSAKSFMTNALSTQVGTHTVNYVVADAAGNTEPTQTAVFHLTRQPRILMDASSVTLNNATIPATRIISGRLADGAVRLTGSRVTLRYSSRPDFAVYRTVSTTTDYLGNFAFSTRLYSKTYYQAFFAGDEDYAASYGSAIYVKPRAALSKPSAYSKQRAAQRFAVSGRLYPAHSTGTLVRLDQYRYSGGRWGYKGYVNARTTSQGSYSSYRTYVALGAGMWELRARALDDGAHAAGYSSRARITVSR